MKKNHWQEFEKLMRSPKMVADLARRRALFMEAEEAFKILKKLLLRQRGLNNQRHLFRTLLGECPTVASSVQWNFFRIGLAIGRGKRVSKRDIYALRCQHKACAKLAAEREGKR